jgi:hypothetical protein
MHRLGDESRDWPEWREDESEKKNWLCQGDHWRCYQIGKRRDETDSTKNPGNERCRNRARDQ